MGFGLLLLYLVLAFIRPYELFPALAPFHVMQLAGGAVILVTLAFAPMTPVTFRAKQIYLMGIFSALVVTSRILALHWFGGALIVLEEFGITVIVFAVAIVNVSTLKRLRIVLGVIAFLAVVLVFQSILAVHFGLFAEQLILVERLELGNTLNRVRGTGFMMDPNDLAQTFVMAFPFLGLAWRKGYLPRNMVLVVFPMLLLLYGVYLTHSRGAILSLLVMTMVASAKKVGRLGAIVLGAAGALGAVAFNFAGGSRAVGGADASATNRIEAWSMGLQLLKAHPFVGVGFGQFPDYNGGLTAHNSVVLAFAELGFPSFLIWVALLVCAVSELLAIQKLKPHNPEDVELQRLARAIYLAFCGFLVSAWFLSRTYILTLYLLIAMGAAAGDIARRRGLPFKTVSFPKLAVMTGVICTSLIVLVYATIRFSVR